MPDSVADSIGDDLSSLAIVGISFNFPGPGSCANAFWSMMMARECAVTEFTSRKVRVDVQDNPDQIQQDSKVSASSVPQFEKVKRGFDAPFFKISADEADEMDPQQGMVLEAAYHALENAGLLNKLIAKTKTSVFVGSSSIDSKSVGIGRGSFANQVSRFFKFQGPSATVDTGGSSGLAAVELACQSLWCGDADMGVAIGCNIISTSDRMTALDKHGMLSPDGRCFSFDTRANGIGLGEGIGALVIKPLKEALRQQNTIRGIIRFAASSYDGEAPMFGQPSLDSQRRLVKDTYEKAGLEIWQTDYFEANGQGTLESDAAEAEMISSLFRGHRSGNDPLYVGSVKSNLGHLGGASGIAAVIKVILCFEKGIIPGNSINYQNPNEDIDQESLNIKILKHAVPWPDMTLRRTSIHSFGLGGSCTHLILEDGFHTSTENPRHLQRTVSFPGDPGVPDTPEAAARRLDNLIFPYKSEERKQEQRAKAQLLVWSTHDKDGVRRLTEAWRSYFTQGAIENLEKERFLLDLSYTLGWRRNHLEWRTFVVANPSQNLIDLPGRLTPSTRALRSPKIAFIFTGEGYAWERMGLELVNRYPAVKLTLAKVNKYLKKWNCQWDILDELQKTGPRSHIRSPKYTLPICTAIQIALVDLLEIWNITPAVVVGYGSGEIAAAYCSRALDLPAAMKIAVTQGRMIKKYPLVMVSAMLSVNAPEEKLHPYITQLSVYYTNLKVDVAYVNTKNKVTVSGPLNQLNALKAMLDDDGIHSSIRTVDIPYHSRGMGEGDVSYFKDRINKWLRMQPNHDPYDDDDDAPLMISTVKGKCVKPETLVDDFYWVENFADAVQFYKAMVQVCSPETRKTNPWSWCPRLPEVNHLLEIGPHPSLHEYVEDILKETGKKDTITYLPIMTQNVPAIETMLNTVGRLYGSGYPVDLGTVNSDDTQLEPKLFYDLPGYPFNHSKPECHDKKATDIEQSQETLVDTAPEVPVTKESLCHRLEWKPDLDLLKSGDLQSLFETQKARSEEQSQLLIDLNSLVTIYILQAVEYLKTVGRADSKQHVRRYRNWMVEQKRRLKAGDFGFTIKDCRRILTESRLIEELHNTVESKNREGFFVSTVCRGVLKVLKQEMPPEDLFRSRLIADYYFEVFTRRPWTEKFGKLLELLIHKKPVKKVLQIGAGNGPIPLAIARATSGESSGYAGFEYAHWDYTDVSENNLEDAKDQLKEQQDRMSFFALDIEKDPEEQGFELGYYDLIIAATAQPTITNIELALKNVHKLLKCGGRLILLGPVRPGGMRTTFAFGWLESWWSEKSGCCVDVNEWDERLQKAGFSGAGLVIPDYDDPVHNELSIIYSTTMEKSENPSKFLVNIQHIVRDETQSNVARTLDKKLKESGKFGVRNGLDSKEAPAYSVKSRLQICLFELNKPGMFDISENGFAYLKRLLTTQTNILWVSGGGGSNPDPRYRIVEGLFRSLFQEDSRMKITSLFLDLAVLEPEHAADQIMKIVNLLSQTGTGAPEAEYVEQDGLLHVGRLMEAGDLNHNLYIQNLQEETQKLPSASDPSLATLDTKPNSYFDPNASYVIAGGLGGLGRVIVRWFVERGARNLIVFSRSGEEHPYAELISVESSVRAAHVVTPSCDISDQQALADILKFYSANMPPIKGCVHAAMALEDSTFENMTYEGWGTATAPKTRGSWNLHQLLPKGLDFFVMLSAVTALTGARGQSNYAAGNTFQDGLARYRVRMGERAVALDLGYFSSGIILDNAEVHARVSRRMDFESIEEWELLAVLDQFCHADAGSLLVSNPQVTVGIQRHVLERGFGTMDWRTRPMFNHLTIPGLGEPPSKPDFAKLIGEVDTLGEAQDNLVAELRYKISRFLGVPSVGLHAGVPLTYYGVDSLLLVHLRAWIVTEVRADIKRSQLEGEATIKTIADWAVENSAYAKTEWEYFQYERYLTSLARQRLLEGNVYYT